MKNIIKYVERGSSSGPEPSGFMAYTSKLSHTFGHSSKLFTSRFGAGDLHMMSQSETKADMGTDRVIDTNATPAPSNEVTSFLFQVLQATCIPLGAAAGITASMNFYDFVKSNYMKESSIKGVAVGYRRQMPMIKKYKQRKDTIVHKTTSEYQQSVCSPPNTTEEKDPTDFLCTTPADKLNVQKHSNK